MSGDQLKSFSTVYNTVVISLIAFLLIASQLIQSQRREGDLESVELLAAIQSVLDMPAEPLDRDVLFNTSQVGAIISDRLSAARRFKTLPSPTQYAELGFKDEIVKDSYQAKVSLRSHPLLSCRIIFTTVEKDEAPAVVSLSMGERVFIHRGPAQLVFFDASECVKAYRSDFIGMIFTSKETKERVFFFPENRVQGIEHIWTFGGFLSREDFIYPELEKLTQLAPDTMKPFYRFREKYFTVSSEALKWSITKYASGQTGKLYKVEQLQDALTEVVQLSSANANILGISAPMFQLTLIAPYLFLALQWSLSRQLSRVTFQLEQKEDYYWPPTDSETDETLLAAIIYSIVPYLLSVLALMYYCAVHENKGFLFGWMWYLNLDLELIIVRTPPIGWIRGVTSYQVYGGAAMLIAAVLSMRVSLLLFSISVDKWILGRRAKEVAKLEQG